MSLSNLRLIALHEKDIKSAHLLFEEVLTHQRTLKDTWAMVTALTNLGSTAIRLEYLEVGRAYVTEGLRLAMSLMIPKVLPAYSR